MADPFAKITLIIESARDLTIEAAVTASTRLLETPTERRPQEISNLLNSRTDREVLNGVKCVIALIARGEDGSAYFADVIKNVTLNSARVRALVMVYIEKYAEKEPDTALLAINTVQKCLGERSARVRAAGIRTLGSIHIPEIALLILLCIKRTITDRQAEVRAATALAIGLAWEIDGIDRRTLREHLAVLLGDSQPLVFGTALKIHARLHTQLVKMLPSKAWAPIHENFRRYVRELLSLDEWAFCVAVDLLTEYVRAFLPLPYPDDGTSSFLAEPVSEVDPDLAAFIDALAPAMLSTSRIVFFSALRALIAVGLASALVDQGWPEPLSKMALAQQASERTYVLQLLLIITPFCMQAFDPYVRRFFISPGDSVSVALCKIRLLLTLFTDQNASVILPELKFNALSRSSEIAKEASSAIGKCCQRSPEHTKNVLRWALRQMAQAPLVVAELLNVVRLLLRNSSGQDNVRVLYKLAGMLNNPNIKLDAAAKSTIIWMIGEFTVVAENKIGPDVLRKALPSFAMEPENVRFELLLLAAKARLYELQDENTDNSSPSRLQRIFEHFLHLTLYDSSPSIRDKARMFQQLFLASNTPLAHLFMQAPKNAPSISRADPCSPILAQYINVRPWADPLTIPPASVRKESTPPPLRFVGMGAEKATSERKVLSSFASQPKANAQLQSLDEFFGDEDDLDDDSDLESESESESEDVSEEELEADSEARITEGEESGSEGSDSEGSDSDDNPNQNLLR